MHSCNTTPACPLPRPGQVPNDVLTGWVLLRARVQQGQGLPFTLEGDGQEFYLLRWVSRGHSGSGGKAAILRAAGGRGGSAECQRASKQRVGPHACWMLGLTTAPRHCSLLLAPWRSQRAQQHATPQEIEAVRKSCAALLKEDGVGAGGAGAHVLCDVCAAPASHGAHLLCSIPLNHNLAVKLGPCVRVRVVPAFNQHPVWHAASTHRLVVSSACSTLAMPSRCCVVLPVNRRSGKAPAAPGFQHAAPLLPAPAKAAGPD